MYTIEIKNCNNVLHGKINIQKKKLNIKYGINGTGKTTLSTAIQRNGKAELSELQTYLSEEPVEVTVSEKLDRIMVFSDEFVNQVVFKEDEVIENSFEVFLKTENYDTKKKQVDLHLENLHKIVRDELNVSKLKALLEQVMQKISLGTTGKPKKSGTYKSILAKTNIYSVPSELSDYQEFFEDSEITIPWIDWKRKGDAYDSKSRCPYCSETINRTEYEKKKVVFNNTYTKSESQNLKEILSLFESLKEYLVNTEYEKLVKYIKEDTAENIIEKIISDLLSEIILLSGCLCTIENFGNKHVAIADIANIESEIKKMKIPTDLFSIFGGPVATSIWNPINDAVSKLEVEIGTLKRELGELKAVMQATITASQEDINEFLRTAGISYELSIEAEDENNSRTMLKQCFTEDKSAVSQIRKHLSWGERNAFSLILFMYYAVMQKPDLIILDDPVSSFDSNKKYAILHRLFKNIGRRDVSFENETVLLLTHDFEPVVDFAVVGKLDENRVHTAYIWNEGGELKEKEINPGSHVKLITTQNASIAATEEVNIVARIASLRLLSELNEKRGKWNLVYEIISSLIHGKNIQIKVANDVYREMPQDEINAGVELIKEYIADFDYAVLRRDVYTVEGIKKIYREETNDYFKLQVFRELKEISKGGNLRINPMDEAWYKFIDETYHIENGSLYALDVRAFNVVPSYIMGMVNNIMAQI